MDKLQPEKAVEILRQHGVSVSLEEAKQILELLRKLAEIAVTQYLSK
jgi:protein-tyrosine-phosphatase